jgi:hypothetical protein
MPTELTVSQNAPRRRRWQFSLATLFVLMTVTCLILSRFYPRRYASVEIEIPAMTTATVPTYQALCHHVVSSDTHTSVLNDQVQVQHLGGDILEFRISGRPKDRHRMREIVDTLADEYVDFLNKMHGSDLEEGITLLQKEYDELNQSDVQTKGESYRIKRDLILRKLEERIEELQERQERLPAPAKVIRRKTGWGR